MKYKDLLNSQPSLQQSGYLKLVEIQDNLGTAASLDGIPAEFGGIIGGDFASMRFRMVFLILQLQVY